MIDMGMDSKKVKTMKVGDYEELDAALYLWFRQQRERNVSVSGVFLQEKARLLYERL